jgi:hypothetical protein
VVRLERNITFAEVTRVFEKREKQSVSEHFTSYISVAHSLATAFYKSYF